MLVRLRVQSLFSSLTRQTDQDSPTSRPWRATFESPTQLDVCLHVASSLLSFFQNTPYTFNTPVLCTSFWTSYIYHACISSAFMIDCGRGERVFIPVYTLNVRSFGKARFRLSGKH